MEIGLPLAGHTGGFHVPLKPLKNIKPKVEIPPEVSPDIKKTLLASAVKNVENKLNLVKQKEQELSGFENLSPDLQKEQEFLYQQRLKLEADLEHLNSIKGVPKEETLVGKWTLEEKQKKYDDLKSLANSGVKLTEKQIDLFDALGVELEQAKAPLEPTARPLEGVKTTEPIPTPELTTLRPLEKAVDTDKPQPFKYPERELYDENNPKPTGMDWTPDVSPEQLAREKAEYERRNSFDGIVEENQRKQRAFEEEQKRRQNEPPDRGLTFNTKEELRDWLDLQIADRERKVQRVQDLLNWAKENSTKEKPITEIQLKNRKVTIEDLLAAKDNLNREIDGFRNSKQKTLISKTDLFHHSFDENGQLHFDRDINGDLIPFDKPTYIPKGALYSKESILKRLNGVIGKYESMLKRIRNSIHAYEQGACLS